MWMWSGHLELQLVTVMLLKGGLAGWAWAPLMRVRRGMKGRGV